MTNDLVAGEREKKLTPWVRDLLSRLRGQLILTKGELDMVTEENVRLRNIIEGQYGTKDDSDTVLVSEDAEKELPLGNGPVVRFGDFFDVRYEQPESEHGSQQLVVETNDPMQIRPQDRHTIFIRRG
jgi:hypothetical protein